MAILSDLEISELVTVKICHDLSGPIGAMSNGVELLKDGGDHIRDQSLDLVGISAKEAVNKLLYYRQAFGATNLLSETPIKQIHQLLIDYYSGTKIDLDWNLADPEPGTIPGVSGVYAKMLLHGALLVSSSLLQGGTVNISLITSAKKTDITMKGTGSSIKVSEEILSVLATPKENTVITVKNIQAYILSQMIKIEKKKLSINQNDSHFEITIH